MDATAAKLSQSLNSLHCQKRVHNTVSHYNFKGMFVVFPFKPISIEIQFSTQKL
jgi:hypothetical protein